MGAASLYGLVVLINFRTIGQAVNRNPDSAIAPVLGRLWGEAPSGSRTVLGNHAWYEEFLALRGLSGLPLYRESVQVLPAALGLGALLLLGWAMRRSFGTRPALVAMAALLCLGTLGRFMLYTWDYHALAVVHTILLAAALIVVVSHASAWSIATVALAGVAAGALSALPQASDPGFVYWALIPLLGTAAAIAWRGERPSGRAALLFAGTVVVVTFAGAALLTHVMEHRGVVDSGFRTTFLGADRWESNGELAIEGLTGLAGGRFFGHPIDRDGALVLVSALLALAALGATLRVTWRTIASLGHAEDRRAEAMPARFVHVTFWSLALVTALTAFVLSSAPVDVMSARYLLTGYVAIGALLPAVIVASAAGRWLVTLGVVVFALVATFQVAREPDIANDGYPRAREANALRDFARAQGATHAYASFWDAASLTWQTRFKVAVYPVQRCAEALCRHPLGYIDSWYRPRAGARSLLVVDPGQPGVQSSVPALGRPLATAHAGALTFYAYDHDLARDVSP